MAKDDFIAEHTKPKMVASMAGLGYLGFLLGGPLGAAVGTYVGHLAGKPAKPAKGSTRDVDVTQLAADLAAGEVALLVDVRTVGEFAGGHVPGAVNIPLDEVTSRTDELKAAEGAELYLVCRSGVRSATAARQLSAVGFDTVNVSGGTLAWVAAGQPVE